jgi:putative PIN family toxin of toxin-antitoxin system
MKCVIDTNILISASLFPDSLPARAFLKAVAAPYTAFVCDYSIDELYRVYNRKFNAKLHVLEAFLTVLLRTVKIIDTPPEEDAVEAEMSIRDLKDRPILRAALASGAELLITGDKDFLESGLTYPRIITPAEFMNL